MDDQEKKKPERVEKKEELALIQEKREPEKEVEKKEEISPIQENKEPERVEKRDELALDRLIELAREPETLRLVLEVREKIIRERSRQVFFSDLAKVLGEIGPVVQDRTVFNKDGTVRYKYSSFATIKKTVDPILAKYGFSYTYDTIFEERAIIIRCHLHHESGHEEVAEFKAPVGTMANMSTIQELGALISYGKRYTLSLLLGLAAEEDTDANIGIIKKDGVVIQQEQGQQEVHEQKDEKKADLNHLTEEEQFRVFRRTIAAILKNKFQVTPEEREKIWKEFLRINYGVESSKELKPEQYGEVIQKLRNWERRETDDLPF